MELDIVLTVTSIAVAGVTSVVGIWIERDPSRAKTLAFILSGLIVMASFVSITQSYMDERDKQKMEADLARMLVMLNQIAGQQDGESGELQALLKSELSTQSRNNPNVIHKVAQRISDNGGDPGKTLRGYLPKAEVDSLSRRGTLKVIKTVTPKRVFKTTKTTRKSTTATPVKSPGTQPIRLKNTAQSGSRSTSKSSSQSSSRPKRALKAKKQSIKGRVNTTKNQTKNKVKARAHKAKTQAKSKAKREVNRAKNKAKSRVNRAKSKAKKKARSTLKSLGL
jgi:hypothetical protein